MYVFHFEKHDKFSTWRSNEDFILLGIASIIKTIFKRKMDI